MDLSLSSDQNQILDAIDSLAKPYTNAATDAHGFDLASPELDAALAEGGFLDVEMDPDLGAVTAALIVEKVARLPYAVEAAASALVRPVVDWELPRPICLAEAGKLQRPVRFLVPGATVVLLHADKVTSFTATEALVKAPTESLYAYPVATLQGDIASVAQTTHDVSPDALRTRWRIALAVEAAGLLRAALDSVVTYVSERKQFGRPIAIFQAVRHRLAEAQVRSNGLYWLAMKAAGTGDEGDAALAAYYAQECATQVVYDLHQFLGAMGVTLEHPLHLWTYRLKALIGDLGGRGEQAVAAADAMWLSTDS